MEERKKKILFLNVDFDRGKTEKIVERLKGYKCDFDYGLSTNKALYDYDILIVDLTTMFSVTYKNFATRKQEITQLLESGGVIICNPAVMKILSFGKEYQSTKFERILGTASNYSWLEFDTGISCGNKEGNTVIPNNISKYYSFFKELFDFELKWNTDFSIEYHPRIKEHSILATNRAGRAVASVIDYEGGGKIVLFPFSKSREGEIEFYVSLTNVGLKILGKTPDRKLISAKPEWVDDYIVGDEAEIKEQKKVIDEKEQEFLKVKQLLFESGKSLVDAVEFILKSMGYEVKNLEKLGEEDLEIKDNDLKAIAEVKGLEGQAKISNLKQLAYYVLGESDTKGIFIINHFKDKKLKERGEPFHAEVIKKAGEYGFCLITTTQLFSIYNDIIFKGNKKKLEDIKEKIKGTGGLLDYPG